MSKQIGCERFTEQARLVSQDERAAMRWG